LQFVVVFSGTRILSLTSGLDGLANRISIVMPVPDQVRDDVSGIQNMPGLLDSGFRQNDKSRINSIFLGVHLSCAYQKRPPLPVVSDLAAGEINREEDAGGVRFKRPAWTQIAG
jgi:hypothetical protein